MKEQRQTGTVTTVVIFMTYSTSISLFRKTGNEIKTDDPSANIGFPVTSGAVVKVLLWEKLLISFPWQTDPGAVVQMLWPLRLSTNQPILNEGIFQKTEAVNTQSRLGSVDY